MLTKKELQIFSSLLTFTSQTRLAPFSFDGGLLIEKKCKTRDVLVWLSVVFDFGSVFVFLNVAKERYKAENHGWALFSLMVVICTTVFAGIKSGVESHRVELIRLVNNTFSLNHRLGEKFFTGQKFLENTFRERLFASVLLIEAVAWGQVTLQQFVLLIYKLQSLPVLILYCTLTLISNVIYFNYVMVGFATFMMSLQSVCFWLKKTSTLVEESKAASFLVYRSIFMLNDLQNVALGSSFIPVMKLGCVFATYVSVTACTILRTFVHPAVFAMFFIYVITLALVLAPSASAMSKVYDLSKAYHRITREKCIVEEDKKNLRSLQILKSTVGGFYHMEGQAKLTLLDEVARGIAFMLITFKK